MVNIFLGGKVIMDDYYNNLKFVKFLNAEEEAELFVRAKGGDVVARSELIESVLPWVVRLVKRVVDRHSLGNVTFDDLVSIGNEMVILAVDGSFDPGRGRLTTYVTKKVIWAVERYIKENRYIIRIPAYVYAEPERVGGDLLNSGVGCLDDVSVGRLDVDYSIYVELSDAIDCLPDRIKFVIKNRLDNKTLKELGDELGVSRERVRQLYEEGVVLLRKMIV